MRHKPENLGQPPLTHFLCRRQASYNERVLHNLAEQLADGFAMKLDWESKGFIWFGFAKKENSSIYEILETTIMLGDKRNYGMTIVSLLKFRTSRIYTRRQNCRTTFLGSRILTLLWPHIKFWVFVWFSWFLYQLIENLVCVW